MGFIEGTSGNDSLVGVLTEENQIFGYAGNDTLIGGNYQNPAETLQGIGSDYLYGGLGDDRIEGRGGNDIMQGNEGDDSVFGGKGDDHMRGNSGVDYFDGGTGIDRVSLLHLDATQAANVDLRTQRINNDGYGNAETMVSVEGVGAGTVFADYFRGNGLDNLMLGDRADMLIGAGGNDEFQIDGACALIDGGGGVDTVMRFTSSTLVPDTTGDGLADMIFTEKGVNVSLLKEKIIDDGFGNRGRIVGIENLGGSSGDDQIVGSNLSNELRGLTGIDTILAQLGDDSVFGGDANDRLNGGAGNDLLNGGRGGDVLTGASGFDIFDYDNALESVAGPDMDKIADFDVGRDKVDLTGIEDEVAGGGALSFAAAFTGVAGQVTLKDAGADKYFLRADLDGNSVADFHALIKTPEMMSFADILI